MNLKILTLEETNTVKEALNLHAQMLLGDVSGVKSFPRRYWGREFPSTTMLEFELALQNIGVQFQRDTRNRQQAAISKKLEYYFADCYNPEERAATVNLRTISKEQYEVLRNALIIFNHFASGRLSYLAYYIRLIWGEHDVEFTPRLIAIFNHISEMIDRHPPTESFYLNGFAVLTQSYYDLLV